MRSHHDIARILLIESYADWEAAKVLRQAGIYARCVAHCQHTVEKALKAALAVRNILITNRHEVSEDFRQTYADWSPSEALSDLASDLESIGFRTEYPLFRRRDLPVWIPSERYTEADADESLRKATRVFEAVENYLVAQHHVQRQTQENGADQESGGEG